MKMVTEEQSHDQGHLQHNKWKMHFCYNIILMKSVILFQYNINNNIIKE